MRADRVGQVTTGTDNSALINSFAPRLRAVAFDVDGTLTDAEHRVSVGNLAALQRLDAAGLPIIVVTGRALQSASATLLDAGLHGYVAACNGALIVDLATEEHVRTQPLDPGTTRAVTQYADEVGLTWALFTSDAIVLNTAGPGGAHRDFMAASNTGIDPVVGTLADVDLDDALKVMFAGTTEELDAAWDGLRRIAPHAERTLDDWAEVCHPRANKWAALQIILGRLGLDAADVAGVGDGGNDVSWLTQVGLSAAMANARPELQEVVDVHIGHHLHDGAADFVDALLAARG